MKRQSMNEDENMKNKDQMDGEGEMDNEEMEDEKKSCGTKKSQDINENDLQKSVDLLADFAKASDPSSRREQLLKKALTEDLSEDEMMELHKAMGHSVENVVEDDEDDSISKSFEDNEVIQKSLDVSDYLSELHGTLSKALGDFEQAFNEGSIRQNKFNVMLAKSMASIGKAVMVLQKSVDSFGNTPVGKPRSVTTKPLNKSFAGNTEGGEQLTKSEVMNGLLALAESGETRIAGYDINNAVAQLETTNNTHPAIIAALKGRKNATA